MHHAADTNEEWWEYVLGNQLLVMTMSEPFEFDVPEASPPGQLYLLPWYARSESGHRSDDSFDSGGCN
jgi:hypothetical protein